jgi:hypothetical protein
VSKQRRWQEPSTVVARIEYRELRKELKRAGSKKRRDELIAKLDALYVRGTDGSPASTSLEKVGSSLPDGSPAEESILRPGTPDSASSVDAAMLARARKLDAAKQGVDAQLKAKKLRIDDALTAVAEQHARFEYEICSGGKSWDGLSFEDQAILTTCQLKAWRNEPVFAHPTWAEASKLYFMGLSAMEKLRQYNVFEKFKASTTPERRKDIFDRLDIAKRMNEPLPDRLLNREPDAVPPPEPETTDEEPVLSAPAPEPSPAIRTTDDQVNLILQIDPHLARLAAHAPEHDSAIRASLTRQLQEHGFADGSFLAGLYNASRPKGVSAFPPRTF